MKRKVKIATDVVMYFIILYLMSYRAGRGLFLHGIFGCFLFVLFMLHHILNGRWYSGLKKGRYRPARIFFVGIDFLLFAAMVGMAASFARTLHIFSTAWGFLFMLLPRGNPYFESFRFYGEYGMITLAFCQCTHLIMWCLQKADGSQSHNK